MPVPPSPRVAVVIPCYDDGETLPAAVASVRAQDEAVELVVVDDGSSDPATLAVMDELEAAGTHVVHQANTGLGLARMAGVRATLAPFVLPLDADDELAPGAVRALADALDADHGLAAAWGWYQRFGDQTTVQQTAPTLDAWQLTHQNDLPATAMFRRTWLLEAGGWRLKGGYEDWDLWLSLAERGARGRGLPRVIYRYRRHGVRMLDDAAGRHAELVDRLRSLHPQLFAARRAAWRRSTSPPALRLALPAIEALPLSPTRKRLLGGVAAHLAHRRGVRTLARRVRES